jgi:hypothetical protein
MGAIGMSLGWLLLLACSVLSGARVCAVMDNERTKGEPMSTRQNAEAKPHDPQTDFDFIIGSWKVRNRRLKQRLKGSDSWEEFEGRAVGRKIWGGAANIDEYDAESPSGRVQGMTLRLYNPKSQQWSIYWANRANGVLDTPMIGGFKDGRGEFYDQEMFEGRSIYVRFIWSNITADSARWEQAFSPDGGKTWETNWIMEFTRASEIGAPSPEQPRK